ncbi:MAG: hypothetical protein K2J00_02105 [Bacteroidaceae bacterium]|nr:hypothetical protein [Bacteroidaceae bacterium]
MKNIVHLFILFISGILIPTLFMTSCGDELPYPDEKLGGNTVIIYMGADNSLSGNAYSDLEEMQRAVRDIPDDCQLVVYKDGELKPAIYRFTNKGRTTWKEFGEEHNSADPATARSILQDIVRDFPSRKYSLILWSHGSGWMAPPTSSPQKAIIQDKNTGNTQTGGTSSQGSWLGIDELADILATLPRMEYIMFDACYMQSVEVAAELYSYTDYIIGSPTEIPGAGAPYHLTLKAMCRADIQGIIDNYAAAYPGNYGVLLSAVSCAEFPAFCEATAKCIPLAFNKENMPSLAGIQIYAPAFGTSLPYQKSMPVPYDMRSAMHRVLPDETCEIWEKQWRKTILYPVKAEGWVSIYDSYRYGHFHCTMTDPEHYGGISMNIPDSKYDTKGWNKEFAQTEWYKAGSWEQTGW